MVGDGADKGRLLEMRDKMGLDNVLMIGQLSKDKMPMLWGLSNVSLVLLKKSDLFKTVIPSKIFESMAMQRPIILGVEGESKDIIEAANSGRCIEPENGKQLAEQIMALYGNAVLCAELGVNGRKYVAEHFDRTVLAKRFESLMQSL